MTNKYCRLNALDPNYPIEYPPMQGSPTVYSPDPCDYRFVITSEGEFAVEMGYHWRSHDAEGIEWRSGVVDLHALIQEMCSDS